MCELQDRLHAERARTLAGAEAQVAEVVHAMRESILSDVEERGLRNALATLGRLAGRA